MASPPQARGALVHVSSLTLIAAGFDGFPSDEEEDGDGGNGNGKGGGAAARPDADSSQDDAAAAQGGAAPHVTPSKTAEN